MEPESDDHFAYIAGYTSGGAPYGITWEEQEEIERRAAAKNSGKTEGSRLQISKSEQTANVSIG